MTSTVDSQNQTDPGEHACGCGGGGCGGLCSPGAEQPITIEAPAGPVEVHVYADVVCPWCYIGKRRLDQAVKAFADAGGEAQVRYMPFQLDPQASTEACELMPTLAQKFGGEQQAAESTAHIAQIAATDDIELDFDGALSVNTLAAHRLLGLAGERDLVTQSALMEKLMAAHFSEGRNIGSDAELQAICDEVGLEVDVETFLSSDEGIDVVTAQQDAARDAGITSVPTYVFAARWGISGAQDVSTLLMVLQQVAAQADAQPGGGGGGCCGGGCCG